MRHPKPNLNFMLAGFTVLAIGLTLISPEIMTIAAPWLLFVSVFVIGIPHGAVDHIVAAELYGLNNRLKDHLLFYCSYLIIMLFIGILWLFLPVVGMILFIAISVYHFGQADMVALLKPGSFIPKLFTWSRGFMIIGVIIFVHPEISLPIIEAAVRTEPGWFSHLYEYAEMYGSVAVLQYILVTILATKASSLRVSKLRLWGDSLLLIALMTLTHPLVGFALYFALWHSLGHVLEMLDFFREKGKSVGFLQFYKLALPFTLVSVAGLILLFYLHQAFALGDEMISLLFILISVLTLPHMLVVDRMFRSRNGQQT